MVVICVESAGVRHHSVVVRCVTVLPDGFWWYLGVCVVLCMIDRLGAAVDIVTKVLISPVSLALIVLSRFPTRKGHRESPAPFIKSPLGASVPTTTSSRHPVQIRFLPLFVNTLNVSSLAAYFKNATLPSTI